MKIRTPFLALALAAIVSIPSSISAQTPAPPPAEETCVDINRAGEEDLQKIIHIGPVRAREILQLRRERPFQSVSELARVNGIASQRVQDIREQEVACVLDLESLDDSVASSSPPARPAPRPTPRRRCCRICTTGKACGNSCINRNYTCRQPRGCACNGDVSFGAMFGDHLEYAPRRSCELGVGGPFVDVSSS